MVGLEGRGEHLGRVDPQAREELGVGPGDPGRSALQPVTVRVLADGDQDLANSFLYPPEVDGLLDRRASELAVDQTGGEIVEIFVLADQLLPSTEPLLPFEWGPTAI